MSIKIYDNLLSKEELNKIQNVFCGHEVDWHYSKTLDEGMHEYGEKYNWQMGHVCYNYDRPLTKHFENVVPILGAIENKEPVNSLIRIKANLYPASQQLVKHGYHVDQKYDCKSALYFVNTNNGYTRLKKEKKSVASVENSVLHFNSAEFHHSTNCTDKQRIITININYF